MAYSASEVGWTKSLSRQFPISLSATITAHFVQKNKKKQSCFFEMSKCPFLPKQHHPFLNYHICVKVPWRCASHLTPAPCKIPKGQAKHISRSGKQHCLHSSQRCHERKESSSLPVSIIFGHDSFFGKNNFNMKNSWQTSESSESCFLQIRLIQTKPLSGQTNPCQLLVSFEAR